jgi:hypothetical protein
VEYLLGESKNPAMRYFSSKAYFCLHLPVFCELAVSILIQKEWIHYSEYFVS